MKIATSLMPVLALLSVVAALPAADSPLDGKWVNTDSNTRSVVELEIEVSESGEGTFRWTGRTHPENSVYGPIVMHLYHNSVGDKNPAKSGVAVHETSFAEKTFTVRAEGSSLVVETFARFTDDSGRSNYHERIVMRRK